MKIDYALQQDFDLQIENGDFVKQEPTDKDIQLLLMTNPDNWFYSKNTGVGLVQAIGGELSFAIQKEFQKQCIQNGINAQIEQQGEDIIVIKK